ncbi:hypothetical protein BWI93_06020 [Siphonobacter sp. BAB-5385]|nr:hypothetical protein BWI93_06020 [Siphonobacter sp. BAB-5385]
MMYLLHSSLILAVFYVVYRLVLQKLTFHTLNRAYLLASLVLSILIPLVPLQPADWTKQQREPTEVLAKSVTAHRSSTSVSGKNDPLNFVALTQWVYGSVVVVLLGRLLRKLILLGLQIRRSRVERWRGLHLISTEHATASFFHWVFLNDKALNPKERQMVRAHEYSHFRRGHSIDVMVVEIFRCIWWFHPVSYWLQKSLTQLHEYEVDAEVVQQYSTKAYAQLILKLAVPQSVGITTPFARQSIKNRIHFLFTPSSISMKKLLFGVLIPLMAGAVILFAPPRTFPPATMVQTSQGSIHRVTYVDYEAFLSDMRRNPSLSRQKFATLFPNDWREAYQKNRRSKDQGVTGVSWDQAMQYCTWKTNVSKNHYLPITYRLPTEQEFQDLFARGEAGKPTGFYCLAICP